VAFICKAAVLTHLGGHLFEVRSEVFVRLPVHRRTTDAHCGQVRVAIFSFGKETA
jgi:hypothetical protein